MRGSPRFTFGIIMEDLKESIEFFDKFVNAALRGEATEFEALEVVKYYSVVKQELAKLLVDKE
jgi:hypothetical protein